MRAFPGVNSGRCIEISRRYTGVKGIPPKPVMGGGGGILSEIAGAVYLGERLKVRPHETGQGVRRLNGRITRANRIGLNRGQAQRFCSHAGTELVQRCRCGGLPHWQNKESKVDRAQKQEMITRLNGIFADAGVVVVSHYAGMTVREMSDLRRRMGSVNANVKVIKNRLAKLSLAGTQYGGISELFKGPTVIAYSADPVAAPKIAFEYSKSNEKFTILGGAMGEVILDPKAVEALAKAPSLDEIRATIVGMVSTPARRIATVLAAPGTQLARVLNAYAEKSAAA